MITAPKTDSLKLAAETKAAKEAPKSAQRFKAAMQRYQQQTTNETKEKQMDDQTDENKVISEKSQTDETISEKDTTKQSSLMAKEDSEDVSTNPAEKKNSHLEIGTIEQSLNSLSMQQPSMDLEITSAASTKESDHKLATQVESLNPTPYSVTTQNIDALTTKLTLTQASDKTAGRTDLFTSTFQPTTEQEGLLTANLSASELADSQSAPTEKKQLPTQVQASTPLDLTTEKNIPSSAEQLAIQQPSFSQLTHEQINLGLPIHLQQMLTGNTATLVNESAKVGQAPIAEAITQQVAQKLVEQTQTINHPGLQKVTIQLQPEQLGKLEISLQLNQQQIQLEVKAENVHTMKLLENLSTRFEQILNKQPFLQQPTPTQIQQPSMTEHLGTALQQNFQQSFQQSNLYQAKPVNRYAKPSEKVTVEETSTEKEVLDSTISILA
ncbi:flagellar hook-length control protein FliK [Enterococcus columbae]|uniref:Flagellar hook-length control protein-like C-terminal domain-containing protein n=1 Tax=Enterococcus columbae DSM 7374 = ATCC 51263 TaxID=1121865 RepID=S1N4R1_9ENTE|nr:flagellar hook-length control protein FliK [Enterococcus columbae]EOT40005.1 hypothetical protein OMW_01794 [Enterococcus columbae DSM 7374 = ATCC 51263]EOW83990.1 hypothetical protein I568_01437 [Enterococcus columbae DSM 7374 = ATCC 51263]